MTALGWRVCRLERRCGYTAAVAAILRRFRTLSDRQLRGWIGSGHYEAAAERLTTKELDVLLDELRKMLLAIEGTGA